MEALALAQRVAGLRQSEQLSAAALAELQARQLQALVAHHARHTPSFAARLKRARLRPADIQSTASLVALPPLTRREIQDLGASFFSSRVPPEHLPTGITSTSGSTGEPVTVRKTLECRLHWGANTERDHRWYGRDVTGRLLSIRANFTQRVESRDWGFPMAALGRTGPSLGLPASMDLADHLRCIDEFQPQTLLTFPNVLAGLIAQWEQRGAVPGSIRHLKAIGETVRDEVRQTARRVCDLPVEDLYSSQECGIIAIQCPAGGHYHVMAESVIVEVLDATGQACAPGEMGRLIITDLRNFASPLIRYEIGDVAIASGPCACGRTLPALERILGRDRNLLVRPDGGRRWPIIGFHDFHKVAQVAQFRFIQHSLEDIELVVHTAKPLQPTEQEGLAAIAQRALEWPFAVRVTHSASPLPRSAGGKFEDFISKVPV